MQTTIELLQATIDELETRLQMFEAAFGMLANSHAEAIRLPWGVGSVTAQQVKDYYLKAVKSAIDDMTSKETGGTNVSE